MKAQPLSSLYSRTGCLPKCAQTKYKFNLKKSTPIDWRSSYISSFYLTAESDQVEEQAEYLVYDLQVSVYNLAAQNWNNFQNLWGDVGGYLGLLLGWSSKSIKKFQKYNLQSIYLRSCYSLFTDCPIFFTAWTKKLFSSTKFVSKDKQ